MTVAIRNARPSDARQIIAYIKRLIEEPGSNMGLSPGEFTHTVKEEREILASFARTENALFLVAEVEGRIVGTLNCRGSSRAAMKHAVTLGMSVDAHWRRQGIGTRLLSAAIDWARQSRIVRRIELSVFERNAPAIALYHKFGFEVEGTRRRAIFRDGEYHDNLIMALLL